ncbi:MAG: nucleotidyltransferase domain-containing protein [Acidobacteriota bacterium]
MAILQRLPVDGAVLASFCVQWKIVKLEMFGSMLVEQNGARDVDLLVTFSPNANWGLFEHARIQDELSEILGRPVDLVSRRAIEKSTNALRRAAILNSAVPIYVA